MDESSPLNDLHFLRDVVARTYRIKLLLVCNPNHGMRRDRRLPHLRSAGIETSWRLSPWVMPGLIFFSRLPGTRWYLRRRGLRLSIEESGVRPRFRKDLMWCWISVSVMGLLWTAGLIVSGLITSHGYLLIFAWCSLLCVGYVMNGVLAARMVLGEQGHAGFDHCSLPGRVPDETTRLLLVCRLCHSGDVSSRRHTRPP